MAEESRATEGSGGTTPVSPAAVEAEGLLRALKDKIAEAEVAIASLAQMSATASAKAAEIAAAAESATVAKAALADATSKAAEAAEVASAAVAAKSAIADAQAVIATKSEHIEGAKTHADQVRAELDKLQTQTTKQATEAEGLKARAQAATDSVTQLLTSVQAQKASVDKELAAAVVARNEAKAAAETAKGLAEKSETIEQRIAEYEKRLAEVDEQSKAQLGTITGLLPGATAAGLASAFDKRRQTFLNPGTRWQWIFVGAVVALIILALTGLWRVYGDDATLDWDELARLWVARLPIAAALIWLALYASRESALAKRLEEDYGYKAAIAASFQGFEQQMQEIGGAAGANTPLAKLCEDTLATIGSPPGRIYDKHELVLHPARELAAAARDLAKAASSIVRPGGDK